MNYPKNQVSICTNRGILYNNIQRENLVSKKSLCMFVSIQLLGLVKNKTWIYLEQYHISANMLTNDAF